MKKLTFLLTLLLVAVTGSVSAKTVELVKAEKIDNQALMAQAKQMLTIQFEQIHVNVDAKQSVNLAKNNLAKKVEANEVKLAKNSVYAANFAE